MAANNRLDRVGAVRRAQRIRDGVSSISDVLDTLVEVQERQDWTVLGYRDFDEYCVNEFGPDQLKLSAERRGQVVGILVAGGMSKRGAAKALGVSEGTVRNDVKRSKGAQNYAPPTVEPQVKQTDDVTAAMTQALTDTAASIAQGVPMSATAPASVPCSTAPDREHCAAGCGTAIPMHDQNAGTLRCKACDPGQRHRAVGIGFDEGHGECEECTRVAIQTSAASVAAANTGRAAGEPDGSEQAAESSGTSDEGGSDGRRLSDPAGTAAPVPVGETLHEQENGWGGVPGDCGVSCTCGVMFDGFDTIAEALVLLNRHIANPEELDEEEAAGPEVVAGCEKCGGGIEAEEAKAGYLRCGTCDPDGLHASAIELDGGCRSCTPHPFEGEGLLCTMCGGGDAAEAHTTNSPAAATTSLPDGEGNPNPEQSQQPGQDHHQRSGTAAGGVAPAVAVAVVEPVGGLEDDGGTSLASSSSSDPGALQRLFAEFLHALDRTDVDVLAPLLLTEEVKQLHEAAERVTAYVELISHWHTP